jgi:ABC-type transport system substrate-binding protein
VEKVIETQVIEKVVTATPDRQPPKKKRPPCWALSQKRDADRQNPHRACRYARQLNWWVGWKSSDRGIQNVADEALWTVDFATGAIINGLAESDPIYNADFTECTINLRKGVAWCDGEPFSRC